MMFIAAIHPVLAFGAEEGHWSNDGLGKWVTDSTYENSVTYFDSTGAEISKLHSLTADGNGNLAFSMVTTLAPGHPSLNHLLKLNGSTSNITMEPTVNEWYEEEFYGQYLYREAKITWTVKATGLPAWSTCSVKLSVGSNFETLIDEEWGVEGEADEGQGGGAQPAQEQSGTAQAQQPQSKGEVADAPKKSDTTDSPTSKKTSANSEGEALGAQAPEAADSKSSSKPKKKGDPAAAKVSVYKVNSSSLAPIASEPGESSSLPFELVVGLGMLGVVLAGAAARLIAWKMRVGD